MSDQFKFTLPEFTISAENVGITSKEQDILVDIFNNPIVKKYLQVLIWNTLKDAVEIPLSTLAEDGLVVNAIKQAYIKGQLSMLYTLNSIEREQPVSVQANQAGQTR